MEVVHCLPLSIIHAVTQCSVLSMLLPVNYACRRKTPRCLRLYHSPNGKEPLQLLCVPQLQLGLTRVKLLSAGFDACMWHCCPSWFLGRLLPGCLEGTGAAAVISGFCSLTSGLFCLLCCCGVFPAGLHPPATSCSSWSFHLDLSTVINIDVVIYSILLITSFPLSTSDYSASLVHIPCLQIQDHNCHVQYQSGREGKRRKKWEKTRIDDGVLQYLVSSHRIQFMERGNLEKFKVSSWECWTHSTMNK